jgi:hypothetical protein
VWAFAFCLFLGFSASGPPWARQGAAKNEMVVVGGWVKDQKRTRVRFIFFDVFYRVFELPSTRNAQKCDKKQIEKKSVLDFGRIFCKCFDTIVFAKRFL